MSLDVVELVMNIEERFGVRIADRDAEKIRTLGDLFLFLQSQREFAPEGACLSSAVFYRTRRVLCRLAGRDRRSICPDSSLEELLPTKDRRTQWERLREALAPLSLPELRRPRWLRRFLLSRTVSLFLVGWAALLFRHPPLALLVLTGAVLSALSYRLTRPFAVCLPAGCGTLRGLVRQAVGGDRDQAFTALCKMSERELWDEMCVVISNHLGVEAHRLTPDTTFTEDLRAD
jgi:acyl carrier protein